MLICLVWASNNVLSKVLVSHWHVPPLFYTSLRFAIVALCTLPWLLPVPRPAWRIVLIGLLMGGGNFALMFVALYWVSASEAAIVVQTSVPMTTLLSIVMLGERIRWRRTLGITLALGGVLIVMYQPGFKISLGMGLLLGVIGFSAAVVGGLGSIYGAVIGGFLFAGLQTLGAVWFSVPAYKDVFAFAVIILLMAWKPTGLLAEKMAPTMIGGVSPAVAQAAQKARNQLAQQSVNPAIVGGNVTRGNILTGFR